MPFVDIFSLLTTFLLFSAVFVKIGILEVQVPFLSNAAPPPDEKPSRSISVNVDMENDKSAQDEEELDAGISKRKKIEKPAFFSSIYKL